MAASWQASRGGSALCPRRPPAAEVLFKLLHQLQAQEPLKLLGRLPFAERLLGDFLRQPDAHDSFRLFLVALQVEAARLC